MATEGDGRVTSQELMAEEGTMNRPPLQVMATEGDKWAKVLWELMAEEGTEEMVMNGPPLQHGGGDGGATSLVGMMAEQGATTSQGDDGG